MKSARILVVEDRRDLRDRYISNIREFISGAIVDSTDSRDGAIELIRRRTYHVALLDIMLIEDVHDIGGLEVLDYIKSLKEGTLAIMLSGSQIISNAIHALRSRICVDYIHKNEYRSPEVIIDPINAALEQAKVSLYGRFSTVSAYLAQPQGAESWELEAMQTLNGCGYDTLNKSLLAAFAPLLPVLRKRDIASGMLPNREKGMLEGMFWSKGLGEAVSVSLSSHKMDGHNTISGEKNAILTGQIRQVTYSVRRIQDVSRDEFVGRIWD